MIGISTRSAAQPATRSPAAAEPPIAAMTTTRGRFIGGTRASIATAARHCAGNASRAPCGSAAASAARSSSTRGSLLTVDVPVHDGGRVPERVEELPQLLHEGHGAMPAPGAADRHRQVRLPLALVERQEEPQDRKSVV